jgi:hypothetical protein
MHLFNPDGSYKGVVQRGELPKPASLTIVSSDGAHIDAVDAKGKPYRFRTAEVLTEDETTTCKPLTAVNETAGRRLAAGDVGVSSGLSSSAVPCVK